ncbi:MAG: hypothetical protein Q9220_007536 [cf. Caloplaca sp. 1 TL-2023]
MLHYRTLTTLLAQTEVVESTRDGERIEYADLAQVPLPIDKALYTAFNHFTTLLVRDDEVVAVLPSGERANAVDVTIAHEPHEWAVTLQGSAEGLPSLPKVKASFIDTPHALLNIKGKYGPAFFRHGYNVPFHVHCQLVLKLLKRNRESSTIEARRQTACLLSTWTMLASHKKMMKRLNSGIKKRNVWLYLAQLTDEGLSQEKPAADDVKSKELSQKAPNQEQTWFLEKLQKEGILSKDWTEGNPLFDKSGRRMIRALLSRLLNNVKDSLEELGSFLTHEDTVFASKLQEDDPGFYKKYKKSRSLASKTYRSLKNLNVFIELFRSEVLLTCQWIAKVFDLRRTTLKSAESRTGDNSPTSSPLGSSLTHEQSSAPEQTVEPDIEASAELNDAHIMSNKGWGEAVLRWLDVQCQYMRALESLLVLGKKPDARQARMSQYVAKVTLKVVDVRPASTNLRMQGFDDFMDNFKLGPVATKKAEDIKGWLKDLPTMGEEAWKKARFSGSWHCESILLSLHALAQDFRPSAAFSMSAKTNSESVEPSANQGSMLMMSKRSYPGSHVRWSPVALPPWLLEYTAKGMIDNAEIALFWRFEEIGSRLLREPRQKRTREGLRDGDKEEVVGEESSKMKRLRLEEEE